MTKIIGENTNLDCILSDVEKRFLLESAKLEPMKVERSAQKLPEIKISNSVRTISTSVFCSEILQKPDLFNVLAKRRSRRNFASLNISQVCSLLFQSCRVRETWLSQDGFLASSRQAPSAGGRHPIEILCVVSDVKEMEAGCWYFDPFKLTLVLTTASPSFCSNYEKLAESVIENSSPQKPPLIILFTVLLKRTLTK